MAESTWQRCLISTAYGVYLQMSIHDPLASASTEAEELVKARAFGVSIH
jgi:hypothetical protein